MFGVTIKTDDFRRALDTFLATAARGAYEGVKEGTAAAEGTARAAIKAQTKRRTGLLLDGTRGYATSSTTAKWVSTAPYAVFINAGTGPHIIRARRARALAFFNSAGVLTFRRAVRHPGTKPRPFIDVANAAGERMFYGHWAAVVDAASHRFNA